MNIDTWLGYLSVTAVKVERLREIPRSAGVRKEPMNNKNKGGRSTRNFSGTCATRLSLRLQDYIKQDGQRCFFFHVH